MNDPATSRRHRPRELYNPKAVVTQTKTELRRMGRQLASRQSAPVL